MYDIIIKDSKILDGTGVPCFKGNVGIKDEKIVGISKTQLSQDSEYVIDGEGLFIVSTFCKMGDSTVRKSKLKPNRLHGCQGILISS